VYIKIIERAGERERVGTKADETFINCLEQSPKDSNWERFKG
jgi:hypothetical protein